MEQQQTSIENEMELKLPVDVADTNSVSGLYDELPEQKESDINDEYSVNLNQEDETITEGIKEGDLISVFSSTMQEFNKINALTQASSEIYSKVYFQINQFAEALTGSKIKKEQIDSVKNQCVEIKDYHSVPIETINNVFNVAGIKIKPIKKEDLQEGVTQEEIVKAFFASILDTRETDIIFNNMMAEKSNILKEFNHQMDELMGSVDLSQELQKISEQMEAEEDPEKKKELHERYVGIYSSLSLDLVMAKIRNKPLSILKKDCKKEFDKLEKKTRKIMVNDKVNSFLDIKFLYRVMCDLFPDNKEESKLLLYIIYKKISKRKEVPSYLATFLNYFILNISKMRQKAFENEQPIIDYKNKIIETLNKLA
jgi:hypothetical protein